MGCFLHSQGEREKLLCVTGSECSLLCLLLFFLLFLLLRLLSSRIWPLAGSLGQVQDAPQQDELGLRLQQSLR